MAEKGWCEGYLVHDGDASIDGTRSSQHTTHSNAPLVHGLHLRRDVAGGHHIDAALDACTRNMRVQRCRHQTAVVSISEEFAIYVCE